MRVLIADDDAFARRILASILTLAGYEVLAVADGAAAWEAARAPNAPRIVLADWLMPEIDGLDLCRRIRRLTGQARAYILLVTSKARSEDAMAALEAGADDFIAKPYAPTELLARVRVAEHVLGVAQPCGERILAALEEAARGEGGEVVVRDGVVFGRVFFTRGRVAWAHLSTEPGSATAVFQEAGVATDDVRAVLDRCRRSGENVVDTLIASGLAERARLYERMRLWIARKIDLMRHLPSAEVLYVPEARSYSSGFTFALEDVLPPGMREPRSSRRLDVPRAPRTIDASNWMRGVSGDAVRALLDTGLRLEGMLGLGVFDRNTGVSLGASGEPLPPDEVKAHLRALNLAGEGEPVEEMVLTTPTTYRMSRTLPSEPRAILFAVLRRERANLGIARLELGGLAEQLRVDLPGK